MFSNPRPSLVFVYKIPVFRSIVFLVCLAAVLVTGSNFERLQWIVTPGEQMGSEVREADGGLSAQGFMARWPKPHSR